MVGVLTGLTLLLFFFHPYRNISICRQPHLVALNSSDCSNEMVVLVLTLSTVFLGQLYSPNLVDGAHMPSIGSDDFHLFFNFHSNCSP